MLETGQLPARIIGIMNVVEQLRSALEAGSKFAWFIFLTTAILLAGDYWSKEQFEGLDDWVLPTIRIFFVASAVLVSLSLLPPLLRGGVLLFKWLANPLENLFVRRRLLRVDVFELIVLCKGLVDMQRTIYAKPDIAPVISLIDKGLLEPRFNYLVNHDGLHLFEIPMRVWRNILLLAEFDIDDLAALKKVLSRECDLEILLRNLPTRHPATIAAREELGRSKL